MILLFVGLIVLLLLGLIAFIFIITKKQKNNKEEKDVKIHTTQEQLPFVYIRRGVVKLKNGQYIKLMQVPSINTQLMEEEEKEIVRETYMGLLNSLDFKVQFYKQSRLVDINDYIAFLKEKEAASINDFKTMGLQQYSRFIMELVKENSVQTKKDFLVVSFRDEKQNKKSLTDDTLKKYRKGEEDAQIHDEAEAIKEEKMFEKAYKTLTQREKTLQKQLRRFGMNATFLNDKDVFELFYIAYNKERSVHQSLKGMNPNNFTTLYVKHKETGGE